MNTVLQKRSLLHKTALAAVMLSLVLACLAFAATAQAATTTVGDFTINYSFSSYKGNTIEVKSYNGQGGDITLPQTITVDDTVYNILSVNSSAFAENKKITSVVIPEGYESIDVGAFQNCTGLKSVEISGSVNNLGASAFKGCTSLAAVTFAADTASSLRILNDVFADCTALQSLQLPARLSSVNNNFVRNDNALTSLTIADGAANFMTDDNILYEIDADNAFLAAYAYGKADTTFTVPTTVKGKTVTKIGMHAFRENSKLTQITVPASVTSLGGYALAGCPNLMTINLMTTTVPTLGSNVCVDLPAGSVINVQSEEVAAAFAKGESLYAPTYYTEGNTTIKVAGSEPEQPKTVKAALSVDVDASSAKNSVVYNIYLDSAENVSTVLLKIALDKNQVEQGVLQVVNANFNVSDSTWTTDGETLLLTAYIGKTGNEAGFSTEEKVKLATLTVPVKDGVSGKIRATVIKAATAGIVDAAEDAMDGETVISEPDYAEYHIADYDVNGDGTVNQVDITEAQRYYQANPDSENWQTKACKADVNGDNVVDIQDFIEIFRNLTDF